MSTATPYAHLRQIVLKLFPWLARVGVDPKSGNLAVRSANTRIDLAPGPVPGPAAARVNDFVVRLKFFPGTPGTAPSGGGALVGTEAPVLWASSSPVFPYTWTQIALGSRVAPANTDPGTSIVIMAGSTRVTCG